MTIPFEQIAATSQTAEVGAVYDGLFRFVASFRGRSRGDTAAGAWAATELAYEARLLDDGDLDRWLGCWRSDGAFWVPLRPDAHPAEDQSLLLDDRRRLGERVAWRRGPSTWAQQPASRVVRTIGSVEAWRDGASVEVRSAIVLTEHRGARTETLAGHQLHRFDVEASDGVALTRIVYKVLLLPQLARGTTSLAFLL